MRKLNQWLEIFRLQSSPQIPDWVSGKLMFYNNCPISRALIGSFLSSIRVQMDIILIYATFKFNSQLSNCQLFNQWDFMVFLSSQTKARKAIDNVRVILNKIHLFLFTASLRCLFSSFILAIWPLWGIVIVKNKLTSVFYASVVLLMINFDMTLSKFTVETLACASWFRSHFDNVIAQFIINKRTDA